MTLRKTKLLIFLLFCTVLCRIAAAAHCHKARFKQLRNTLEPAGSKLASSKHGPPSLLPRFTQSKSQFNLFLWLTNILYPGQQKYKPQFQSGGCPGWYLNPAYGPPAIEQDFLQTGGWSYDVPNSIIQYQGSQEDREPSHPFPFFFLYRRTWTRSSLIKKNFFCQNTQIASDIQLNGAEEAGLIFRVIGDWNFWGVVLNRNGKAQLVRDKEGEKIVLQEASGLTVRPGEWYSVQLNEMIGDVKVTIKDATGTTYNMTRSLEDIEEIEDQDQGAVGLLASKGPARFRNTFFGNVNWAPNDGGPGKLSQFTNAEGEPAMSQGALGLDFGDIEKLKDSLRGWCPPGAICAGQPYDYATSR